MITEKDVVELTTLEEGLWKEEFRFSDQFEKILSDDFFEFGRSGNIHSRQECLDASSRPIQAKFPLENLKIRSIADDVVQITYISSVMYDSEERGLRSSIWVRTSAGWRLKFHQGTVLP